MGKRRRYRPPLWALRRDVHMRALGHALDWEVSARYPLRFAVVCTRCGQQADVGRWRARGGLAGPQVCTRAIEGDERGHGDW